MTEEPFASEEWWEEYRAVVDADVEKLFRAYLKPVLDDVRGVRDEPLPDVFTPAAVGVDANK
ncbi:hypothetical protein [Halomarina ordinaria]|uniref:Uncharacterized protein n=1 Tax=Halomarina ordinaria TaxID=3033939 RepID=A0ABD5UGT4_9EURY|nr:hypothetical protein [Halomarina sp. PSRA2]